MTITGTGFVGVARSPSANNGSNIVYGCFTHADTSGGFSTRLHGAVRLVTPGGTASLNGFVFTAPVPVITGLLACGGNVEQPVTITGRNFAGDLTTLAVSFGGRAAGRFVVVNDSTITAYVGGGATGSVSVRTPGGTANRLVSPSFRRLRSSRASRLHRLQARPSRFREITSSVQVR